MVDLLRTLHEDGRDAYMVQHIQAPAEAAKLASAWKGDLRVRPDRHPPRIGPRDRDSRRAPDCSAPAACPRALALATRAARPTSAAHRRRRRRPENVSAPKRRDATARARKPVDNTGPRTITCCWCAASAPLQVGQLDDFTSQLVERGHELPTVLLDRGANLLRSARSPISVCTSDFAVTVSADLLGLFDRHLGRRRARP